MTTTKFLRKPVDYAIGNYVAPGKSWNGLSRRFAISDSNLAAGAEPALPIPADVENAREVLHFDAAAVQLHEAVSRWSVHTPSAAGTYQHAHVLPILYPGVTLGNSASRHGGVLLANKGATQPLVRIGSSCLYSAPSFLGGGPTAGWTTIATAPNGLIFGLPQGGSGSFADVWFSTNYGNSFASTGAAIPTATALLKSSSYFLIASSAVGKVHYCATVSGTYTAVTIDPTFPTCVQLVEGPPGTVCGLFRSAPLATEIYYSTDGGASWTRASSYTSFVAASLTWSSYYSLFVVLTLDGELWYSADGAAWFKTKTVASLAGFAGGQNQITMAGPVLAALIERTPTVGLYARGIAYSVDFGANWNEVYFGQPDAANMTLRSIATINNRIYAVDYDHVYISGPVGSIDTLYTGA